jgi:receptor-type tyrosine-protein phosphatase beta
VHLAGPNPVSNIAPLVDSTNVTLEWPRPEGRIDKYSISWQPDEPEEIGEDEDEDEDHHRGGFGNKTIDGSTPIVDGRVRVLIGDLMPGAKYLFKIFTTSYKLMSDITQLTTRTSKFSTLFNY